MAKKKTKIKPSFEIELLDCEKAVAHKRLGPYDTPRFYSWAEDYYDEKGEVFELDGFMFFRASAEWIIANLDPAATDLTLGCHEIDLYKFALWSSRNFPAQGRGDKPGRSRETLNWCRTPNGRWMVKDWDIFYIVNENYGGGLDNEPKKSNRFGSTHWSTNEAIVATPSRESQITYEFKAAWKKARDKYRKANKDQALTEHLREEKTREARKTTARMDVLLHIGKLMDNLQSFKEMVEHSPEDITVERVREVFDDTNKMTSVNSALKKALGIR